MEPLSADMLEDAEAEARVLFAQYASDIAMHIFKDEERVLSLRAKDLR